MCCRACQQGRIGDTAAEAADWLSDTAVSCLASAAVFNSLSAAVTSSWAVGSGSTSISYDDMTTSSVRRANMGSTGSASVTVVGAGMGASRFVVIPDMYIACSVSPICFCFGWSLS